MKQRVVVTGLGAISAVGCDVNAFWSGIKSGRCGVGPITVFDPTNFPCKVAAQVNDFDPKSHLDHKLVQRTARFTQFALVAAREAWGMAGLAVPAVNPYRTAVVLGNGIGGLEVDSETQFKLFEKGPGRVPAMAIPRMIANEGAGNVSMDLGIRGIAHTVITACASGTDAMGHALELIRHGRADIVVTGGTEATIIEFAVAGFCALKALSTSYNDQPQIASRPFDVARDGFVMGEGAGILIFESLESAIARNVPILAEVAGWGGTSDAYHLTAPDPKGLGAAEAIRLALADAGMTSADLDYINAHGTATPTNDPIETLAIHTALGAEARRVKVSSIKGATGHCLGAAGGLEGVTSVLAIQDGFYPPTLNLDEPDPMCDLDYVPKVGIAGPIRSALSLSLGFGGHNSVIAFRRFDRDSE